MAFAVAAPAQQIFQCVNPDVLNSLVFNAFPESKLVARRTMPDNQAGFRAPAEFTLIGSGERGQGLSTIVAYKTTLETRAAFDSLLGFLFSEGWTRESTPQLQLPTVSVAGPQPATARLCRDGERRNLFVQEIDGVRYATISGFETTPPRACGAPSPQPDFNPIAAMNARNANLPRFSFPESARADTRPSVGNGVMDTRIDSPDSATSLARRLARQLVEQGWRSDAEWNGKLSTGSTWSRSTADGEVLWGTLEILGRGEGTYDVGFSLVMRPL
jgi:hypothetical protein